MDFSFFFKGAGKFFLWGGKGFLFLFFLSPLSAHLAVPPQLAPFPLDQEVPHIQVEVLRVTPPFAPQFRMEDFRSLIKTTTVILYVIPGNPPMEEEIQKLYALSKKKKWQPLVIFRGISPQDRSLVSSWAQKVVPPYPVVLDGSLQLALGLRALQLPSYSVVDEKGVLKIRGIRGLDRKLQNGTPLVDILSRTGKEGLPLSDGEMVEDIRTLQGKPVPSVTFRSVLPKEGEEFPLPGGLKKPTLIVFWIATCPHCQKEIPRIVEFWRMRKKELDIVTVTRVYPEEIRKITDRYLKERSLQDLPVYEGTEEIFQKFRVEGVPAWAMVSPSGRVVQAFVGEDPDLFYHLNEALQKAGK